MRRLIIRIAVILVLATGGCSLPQQVDYLLPLGVGEARVLVRAVPIAEAIDDPKLDPETREKLLWVRDVIAFARDELGLVVGESYSHYYDTEGGPAMYNVSASAKDSLTPLTWTFPIVGTMEYLPYFFLNLAKEHEQRLKEQGYDTYVSEAIAYSSVGWFNDPLYSSMFELDWGPLAETVIHELTHNTIYKKGDPAFNESLATFVGQCGATSLIERVYGANSAIRQQFVDETADQDQIDQFVNDLHDDLQAFYARDDLTSEEKIAGRSAVYEAARQRFREEVSPTLNDPDRYERLGRLAVNNAWVLMYRRYHKDLDVFEQVYQAQEQDLSAALTVFAQAAQADDSFQYLRDWLAANQ